MNYKTKSLAAFALLSLFTLPATANADGLAPAGPIASFPWMHKGVRITFRQTNGFTPGTMLKLTPDPDGKNFDAVRREGSFNDAIWQQDIVALDADRAIINDQSFVPVDTWPNIPKGTPPQLGVGTGFIADTSKLTFQDYWMQPAQLDQYVHGPQVESLKASAQPFKIGDQTFDAVWIVMHEPKFISINIYDHKTGLLLHRGITSQGDPPQIYAAAEPVPAGDVFNLMVDFISMRDINIPWADEPLSDALTSAKVLHFRQGYTVTGMPGPPAWVYSRLDNTITDHGNGWVKIKVSSVSELTPNMPAQSTEVVWGPDIAGGPWAGPIALAKLRRGQVIDEDPITKMRTVVTNVDNRSVTITDSNGTSSRVCTYDKQTGINIGVNRSVPNMYSRGLVQMTETQFLNKE